MTGLKACNIAEGRPAEDFVGDYFALDEYLARNPAPKVILTSWGASDLQLDHGHRRDPLPEGYVYALQMDRGPWLWKSMVSQPATSAKFLLWAQSALIKDTFQRVTHTHAPLWQVDDRAIRQSNAGLWRYPSAPQRACMVYPPYAATTREQDIAGITAFRKRYATAATRVIVDVSPMASCERGAEEYVGHTAGIVDNTLEVLPISEFNSQNIHLTREASERFSREAAEQVVAVLAGRSAGKGLTVR